MKLDFDNGHLIWIQSAHQQIKPMMTSALANSKNYSSHQIQFFDSSLSTH